MAVTGLGVAPDSEGNGCDPLTHRRIIAGRWASKGVVTGLNISTRSDLRYDVSAGVAVLQRSASDGMVEAYWPGGTTPAVPAGDPSNPRIDVAWLRQNDPTQGDSDNRVTLGVTAGTPAASPQVPSVPAGALPVSIRRMPAGATSTRSAADWRDRDYAIPYGAGKGLLAQSVLTDDEIGMNTDTGYHQVANAGFWLPTDRIVEVTWRSGVRNADGKASSFYLSVRVDGTEVQDGIVESGVSDRWLRQQYSWIVERLGAGTHSVTAHVACPDRGARNVYSHGFALRVWDRGVAR